MKVPYYSAEQKLAWLDEWKRSGLSAKAFSKDKPFSPGSLFYWRRQEKEVDTRGFIPISSPSPTSISGILITYPNGIKLEVHHPLCLTAIKSLVT